MGSEGKGCWITLSLCRELGKNRVRTAATQLCRNSRYTTRINRQTVNPTLRRIFLSLVEGVGGEKEMGKEEGETEKGRGVKGRE